MATHWRKAGLTYIHYSNVAAKVLRSSLKPDLKQLAAARDVFSVTFTQWVNGKPVAKPKPQK